VSIQAHVPTVSYIIREYKTFYLGAIDPPTVDIGTSNSKPKRQGTPKEHELDRMDYSGKHIQIISRSAAKWEKIALRLYFDGNKIKAIQRDVHFQTEEACRTVFNLWLEGTKGLRERRTWATVVDVLKEADLITLSEELNSILS
jgi:hypothetical protein